jgi:hypothetical protein
VCLRASRVRNFLQAGKYAVAAITVILALSGCAQPWGDNLDANAIACEGYGFPYGGQAYEECLKYIESRRGKRAGPVTTAVPAPTPNVICKTQSTGTIDCQTRQ